jgi:hypothetical protein
LAFGLLKPFFGIFVLTLDLPNSNRCRLLDFTQPIVFSERFVKKTFGFYQSIPGLENPLDGL